MIKHTIKTSDSLGISTDCLVIGVYADGRLTPTATKVDRSSNGLIKSLLKRGDIAGKCGQTLMVPCGTNLRAKRLLLVGLGDQKKLNTDAFTDIVQSTAKALQDAGITTVVLALAEGNVEKRKLEERIRIIVETFSDFCYQFNKLKSNKSQLKKTFPETILFPLTNKQDATQVRKYINQGKAISQGVELTRDLANLPGNICTPSYLAAQARKLQRSHQLKVSILNEQQMRTLKMGSLLSVSRGSREPAKLIIMEYRGGPKNMAPIALVGKGLTFDAGGISLKPAGKMDEMKYDMCGGASVFGTLVAAAELKLPLNVIGIVPSSENLPDGAANKPGDIVTSMSGKTIEILNTDAEGRLILCDALTYARRYNPDVVIDIATLTGACVVALGDPASGLFSKHDKLASEILQAGEVSGDYAWRLPLWDQYQKQINSPFADIQNIGGSGGGAITAACFLARFTEDLNWAHLDVAGTAYKSGAQKGATGRPVRLLTQFLIERAKTKSQANS
ncbi:MAG: leucyl aminopeptidase [Acidiferrobacteraceae bacterium]|nr:leucyl aminopeptidase [Acidiferrobacteraceae bacterium]|tara:strand:+ start:1352 stop:2866 length:1515 start_codon:yes stop_codon:yes gene_type:complete